MEDGHRSSHQNLPFENGSHWMTVERGYEISNRTVKDQRNNDLGEYH